MRAVFDTDVIVAGLVAAGLCRELVEIHLPEHIAILSRVLWDELDLAADDLPFLDPYRRHAIWVDAPALDETVCRDPDDDWVLATAVAGEAEAIVTGDDDARSPSSFRGVAILSPRGA